MPRPRQARADEKEGERGLAASPERARLVAQAADEARALEILVLYVGELLPLCDYFVICHSRSPQHGDAITDKVRERMKEAGVLLHHREGQRRGEWVILDYGDVVLHVFSARAREFYALERLWAEAPRLEYPRYVPAPVLNR